MAQRPRKDQTTQILVAWFRQISQGLRSQEGELSEATTLDDKFFDFSE